MIPIKNKSEIKKISQGASKLAQIVKKIKETAKIGVTTAYLDELAYNLIKRSGAEPAFLRYNGFPATICASFNEEVVHGIPSERKICDGDLLSIDIGLKYKDYFSDMAVTIAFGNISKEIKRLIEVTEVSLRLGMAECRDGNTLGDIGNSIESFAKLNGFSVVRDYVGHGIGRALHESPQIPNFGIKSQGTKLKEGMVFAIEPMVNFGSHEVKVKDDNWTVVTIDGQVSAHAEHTVLVTKNGPIILTT